MQLGYLVARAYASYAQLPIKDAILTVYTNEGDEQKLIGVRLTDENGKTLPIPIEAPDKELSTSPGNSDSYAVVNLRVDHPDYNTFYAQNVQVFAGQVSVQNAEMIPTAEHIPYDRKADFYYIESNNLN